MGMTEMMAHIHHGSLLASTEPGPLVDSPTDSPLSEQALALVLRKPWSDPEDDHASTSEQTDDDDEFEEITYDELRLSICPADPAHFAPVFGECRPRFVGAVGTQILTRNWPGGQTTSAPTTPPSSPARAHPSRD